MGHPADGYGSLDNIIRSWRGDDNGTQAATAEAIKKYAAMGSAQPVLMAHSALAILHIGAGRYEEALVETDFIRSQDFLGFTAEALPLAVEAAVRVGETAKARAALAEFEVRATSSGSPWALGLLARSKALLAKSSAAEDLYLDAINLLSQTSVKPEVAHSRLLYGEWLRRERRRLEAREQLRLAYDYFSEIGALGFSKRAHAELLATGERARTRTVEHVAELTAREQRIAELASEGFSNREIGSQLFISATTVEYHLGKVYRKLAINSRGKLKGALEAADGDRT
jgi:ATP/maltotriose-dependent transcriptional regulator MalT